MSNYTEHDALIVFGPNSSAVLIPNAGVVSESWEHAAALYESYAADNEYVAANEDYNRAYEHNGMTTEKAAAYVLAHTLGGYADAAEKAADSTWEDDLRSLGFDEDTFDE
jgi:hypothetical protein